MPIRGSRRPSVVPITAPSFPTPPRPHVYRKIAYSFIALTVVVILAVLWLSSVRAEVTVRVKKDPVRLDGTVDVAKTPQSEQIPGRVVQSVFERVQEFPVEAVSSTSVQATSTPSVITPDTSEPVLAKGTVRIINKYSKAQTLVRTTRLLTADGKLYRIDKRVDVPSGNEVSVSVYADKPGSEFVIGPTKFTIPGLDPVLQKYIYAVSDAAFVGKPVTAGSLPTPTAPTPSAPKSGKVVTGDQLDRAYQTLTNALLEQAKQSLAGEVNDPKFTEAVYMVKVLDKKSNATVGQSADSFLASVKIDVTAVYYSKQDMFVLIRTKLKEKVPEGRELLPFDENGVSFALDTADTKQETASLHVTAQANYRLSDNHPLLQKDAIAGKSKADAVRMLEAVDGVEDAQVELRPGWMSKIPTLKDHIDLKIE